MPRPTAPTVTRLVRQLTGPAGPAPTTAQLSATLVRHIAGMLLVLTAAALVHRTGHVDQQWQYVAIAGALIPQALIAALALRAADRRGKLRTSRRPAAVPGLVAAVLTVAAPVSFLAGEPGVVAFAALCAAAGLGVAAAPTTVTIPARS